ncbi:hypothetical protein BSL78_13018 [Apostichopus japonicus]|uniref:Rho-GAP domain-containing protein n=1 Tax=Stichopus japonicus TaxID=307972 RepID=A0A2G8KQ03_STIJA|nr:hypothetical protein BSL78_13018 [Apostichopus japonicus]
MGDRQLKGCTRDSVCLEMITKGWSLVPLRDEIYMQLCRQTTENFFEDSLRAGWELLSISLNFFPPLRLSSPTSIITSASTSTENTTSEKKGTKLISQDEIQQARESICSPSMFGEMLEDVMALQETRFPDRKLPWIVVALTEEILRLGAEKTEGIFRVSGDIDEVNSLKLRCDQWLPLSALIPMCSLPT